MIYDTAFLVALERRRTRPAALAFLARHQDEPARLRVVVLGEMAAAESTMAELHDSLDAAYTIEPLIEEVAWEAFKSDPLRAETA